ncbi:hypothetical protein BCEP4_1350041 [Burkholderia cepacia]|nr:hypothetical protein BCEP4_1350041 [Burkholderia cepacia]
MNTLRANSAIAANAANGRIHIG